MFAGGGGCAVAGRVLALGLEARGRVVVRYVEVLEAVLEGGGRGASAVCDGVQRGEVVGGAGAALRVEGRVGAAVHHAVVAAGRHEACGIDVVVELVELVQPIRRGRILVDFVLDGLLADDGVVDDYGLVFVWREVRRNE